MIARSSGEHHFGVGRVRPSNRDARAIDAIAREHGAKFVQAQLPDGYRHWFVAPNMGEPFDSGTARSVLSAIAYAGIRLGGAQ